MLFILQSHYQSDALHLLGRDELELHGGETHKASNILDLWKPAYNLEVRLLNAKPTGMSM